MKLIANALNSRETISWKETIPDLLGANYTITSSKLTEVNADSSACSLGWTSVYTSSDDKLVESFLVRLGTVSSVVVQPYSRYRQSAMQYKFEVSPETYVILVNTNTPVAGKRDQYHKDKLKSQPKSLNDHEARVVFADEQTANTVADSIRRAVKMCPAMQSAPDGEAAIAATKMTQNVTNTITGTKTGLSAFWQYGSGSNEALRLYGSF